MEGVLIDRLHGPTSYLKAGRKGLSMFKIAIQLSSFCRIHKAGFKHYVI